MFFLQLLHWNYCCLFIVFHVVIPLCWEIYKLKSLLVLKFSLIIFMNDLHQTLNSWDFCCSQVTYFRSSFFSFCKLTLSDAITFKIVEHLYEANDFFIWQKIDSSALKILINWVFSQRNLTFLWRCVLNVSFFVYRNMLIQWR